MKGWRVRDLWEDLWRSLGWGLRVREMKGVEACFSIEL